MVLKKCEFVSLVPGFLGTKIIYQKLREVPKISTLHNSDKSPTLSVVVTTS